MKIKEYQYRVIGTNQNPPPKVQANAGQDLLGSPKYEIIPLLGLVGEVGSLLSEYKKMLRDGANHEEFHKLVSEELGDILWYVATVATTFNLDLEKVATANISKIESRWHSPDEKHGFYDEECSGDQKLPRKFSITFSTKEEEGIKKVILKDNLGGEEIGDPVSDNTYEDDGYRFHDILHLTFWCYFGWTPIFRKILRKKYEGTYKKRDSKTDEAQDSGRPQVIEEGIIAAAYVYAEENKFLEGTNTIDWQLLRHLKQMTKKLEVGDRSTFEWNEALLEGFKIWRKLIQNGGGTVEGDLHEQKLKYTAPEK